jgi:hypothetical protein
MVVNGERHGPEAVIAASTFISLISLVLSTTISSFALLRTYFYRHRELLFVLTPVPGSKSGTVMATDVYRLSPIFSNRGNQTEVVLNVSIAINPIGPSLRQLRGAPVGPFVLKSGDAVTADISLSFNQMLTYNQTRPAEQDLYVRVVTLSPKDGVIAVDIPIARISLMMSQDRLEGLTYNERRSNKYNQGLINLFKYPRSNFAYDASPSGAQLALTIQVGPSKT